MAKKVFLIDKGPHKANAVDKNVLRTRSHKFNAMPDQNNFVYLSENKTL